MAVCLAINFDYFGLEEGLKYDEHAGSALTWYVR